MTSLFDRLDVEEAIVRGELAALRDKVAQAEERLAHLSITRETLLSLTGEEHVIDGRGEAGPQEHDPVGAGSTPQAGALKGRPAGASGPDEAPPSSGRLGWEVARERMLVLLAGAGRAMKVQDIAAAIGEDVTDTSKGRRVETTRSRLKTLVKEGQVVEGPTAWFAIAPAGDRQRRDARE
ncbi:hypothetical protein [Streptomyces sp. NBC_01477]|uniref:hypothetical protein n=1 Tax=Streptomyces sp. NBC_01477 TaxID=2976015 RepID=UPI002E37E94F|nr:hypothetical protein [Streptomyces sp. NBC_01477]